MQSKATTVQDYLAELPEDRRDALRVVRGVILENLDKDYEEGMQYGMIGYYVPHRVFPAGYHCDPKQPLPFAGMASQKGHMSLYLMCVYGHTETRRWFEEAWAKTGKKLDMGKACIRFKRLEDVPLDVIGEAIRRVPARTYLEIYQETLRAMGKGDAATVGVPRRAAPSRTASKAARNRPGRSGAARKATPRATAKKRPARRAKSRRG